MQEKVLEVGCTGMMQGTPPDPCTVVIFGVVGDLGRHTLIPSLYALGAQGLLPEPFIIAPATGTQVALVWSVGCKSLSHLQGSSGARDHRDVPWMVYSAQEGRSPWQRAEVRTLQHHRCAQCGQPLAEVHHRPALRRKTDPTQAGYQATKVGL
jgi:hypothetical protein